MRIIAALALGLPLLLTPALAAGDVAEARIGGDRFVAGGSVRHSSSVDGDLFGMGGNFDLQASVAGDAVLGGGEVRVREKVAQDLYAGGGYVRVEAEVGRNARLAGGNVEIAPAARITRNLTIGGGRVEIRAPVGGDVQVAAGEVLIDSTIGGDVRVAAGELTLGPNARIAGRLKHRGTERIRQDPAAQVAGGIERGERNRFEDGRRIARGASLWGSVVWTLGLVALAALIAGAFPTGSRRMGESLRGDPAMALLLGFITLVCVPVAAMMLVITIIGIPLAVVLLLLYFLVLLVGYATVAVVIGDTALARFRARDAAHTGWRVAAAMGGMVALAVVTKIPYLGGLIVFAVLLAGLGAIVLAIRAQRDATRPPAMAV